MRRLLCMALLIKHHCFQARRRPRDRIVSLAKAMVRLRRLLALSGKYYCPEICGLWQRDHRRQTSFTSVEIIGEPRKGTLHGGEWMLWMMEEEVFDGLGMIMENMGLRGPMALPGGGRWRSCRARSNCGVLITRRIAGRSWN